MTNTKTHWLKNPNKNYLGHWDLPDKEDLILTIKSAQWEKVKNPISGEEKEKRVVRFKEKGVKPLICNETNASAIVVSSGVKFLEDSAGVRIKLYVATILDRRTKNNIDCVRIRTEKPPNPELLPTDKTNWDNVVNALVNGFKMAQVLTRWTISKENQDLLNSEVTNIELLKEAGNE